MLPYSPASLAEALLALLDDAAARRGRATLAIPGGRSPGPVLTHLARICDPFVRDRLSLLWLDERAVPLEQFVDVPRRAAQRGMIDGLAVRLQPIRVGPQEQRHGNDARQAGHGADTTRINLTIAVGAQHVRSPSRRSYGIQ